MLDIDKAIDAFRRSALDIDCRRMLLAQHKESGHSFEGQGYVRQLDDGTLIFKIYVAQHNAKPFDHLNAMFGAGAGRLHTDEMFYDLDATGHDGTNWTAARILVATVDLHLSSAAFVPGLAASSLPDHQVADRENNRVRVFDRGGRLLEVFPVYLATGGEP